MRTLSATIARVPPGKFGARGLSWLLSSSAGAFGVLCAGAGITYAAQLVIARAIGPEGFGIYAYVVAWVTLCAYVATLGFHTSLLRLLPAYEAQEAWPLARGVLRCAMATTLALGAAFALLIVVFADWLADGDGALVHALRIGAVAIPLIAFQLAASAGARAFGGPVVALVPERILRDGTVLVIVAGATLLGLGRPDAAYAVLAFAAGCAVALAFALTALRLLRPRALAEARAGAAFREWLGPALPLTVLLFADNVLVRSGVLVLGMIASVHEAGLFAIAFGLSLLAALPRMAIASAFAPQVSALHARADIDGLRTLSARSTLLSLIATICVAIPLLSGTPVLLGWLGHSFLEAAPIVAILMAGQVFAAAFGPQQHLLTMTGNERASAVIFLIAATFGVAAALALVPILGIHGAAFASVGSTVLLNVTLAVAIRRHLTLPPGMAIGLGRSLRRGRGDHAA